MGSTAPVTRYFFFYPLGMASRVTTPNMVRVCPNGHRQQRRLATQRERNARKRTRRRSWALVAQSAPHPRDSLNELAVRDRGRV